MKILSVLVSFFIAIPAFAFSYEDIYNSCIWDGEEYLKKPVLEEHTMWTKYVYDLHQQGDFTTGDFEGIGSCRFFSTGLGEDFESALEKVTETGYQTPTMAYFFHGNGNNMAIPGAYYAAGGELVVAKNFYSHDRPACTVQKQNLITASEAASIRFEDISVKVNQYGGVSAIINKNTPEATMYGVCHFHKLSDENQ